MRKLLLVFIFLGLIAGAVYYYLYHYLPEQISQTIAEENIALLEVETSEEANAKPKKVKAKEALQATLKEKDIKVEEIIDFVENVDLDEVESFMDDCAELSADSAKMDLVYLKTHFDFGNFPIDSFETEFEQYFDPDKMDEAIAFYQKNKSQMPVLFPMLKKTAIRYLEKIEKDKNIQ